MVQLQLKAIDYTPTILPKKSSMNVNPGRASFLLYTEICEICIFVDQTFCLRRWCVYLASRAGFSLSLAFYLIPRVHIFHRVSGLRREALGRCRGSRRGCECSFFSTAANGCTYVRIRVYPSLKSFPFRSVGTRAPRPCTVYLLSDLTFISQPR